MARLNRIIERFEQGKPAFGAWVNNGNLDDTIWVTDSGYDYCLIENMENQYAGFGIDH